MVSPISATNLLSRRTKWIVGRVALGIGALLAVLLLVRVVASLRARQVLATTLATSTTEVERLRAPRTRLVLPAFDGAPLVAADCARAQFGLRHNAPEMHRQVAESRTWLPPGPEQIAFVAEHGDEIAAFGEAVAKCDRVAPATAVGRGVWERPVEMYRRARVLVLAGRVRAAAGDFTAAARLLLQSRRLGIELALDGNLFETIVGASAIRDADDALARLVAVGPGPVVRAQIDLELAALEPFMPNLADAVRLDQAEQANLVSAVVLKLPFLLDVLLAQESFGLWESGPLGRLEVVVVPPSAGAAAHLASVQAEIERALREFATFDAKASEPEADADDGSPYESTLLLSAKKARDVRWQLLGRGALLEGALQLERARDSDGRYPEAPGLPQDPYARGKPLTYALLLDGSYRLSSAGTSQGPREAWIIVSAPGRRAEPAAAEGRPPQ